jgi:L-arabinose isomerase
LPKQKLRRFSPQVKTTALGTFRRIKKGEIAQKVELYGSAYQLAWKQIQHRQRRDQPDISLRIHASIRRQLKAGATDPQGIAFKALKDVHETT